MNTDILEPGSLRVTDEDSKEVKVFSEDGSCVKGKVRNGAQPGLEPAICESQVRYPPSSATASPSE